MSPFAPEPFPWLEDGAEPEEAARRELVSAAAQAVEEIDADELEAHAANATRCGSCGRLFFHRDDCPDFPAEVGPFYDEVK